MSFHKDSLDANNHTLTAFTYDDITARDADTAFQVTANINKMVRVDSPASYFILQSLSPTVWSEVQQAGNALLKTGGAMTGAITTNSTFDGVDVGARDGVLTTTTTTANAALPKVDALVRSSVVDGRFDFWFEDVSQTSSGYGSDTMWLNENVGSTKVHTQQPLVLGVDIVAVPTAKFFSRTVVTSVAGAGNFVAKTQRIEGVTSLAGKTATISLYAKADSTKDIAVEFVQDFGTGGSPSADVTGILSQKITLSTSWVRYDLQVTIPSISGKTLGTNGDDSLQLIIYFDAGSTFNTRTDTLGQQSGTFEIACVQLERGAQATGFVEEGKQESQSRVERYYETTYDNGVLPGTITAIGCIAALTASSPANGRAGNTQYRSKKRGTPSIIIFSTVTGAAGFMDNLGGDVAAVVLGIGDSGWQTFSNAGISDGAIEFHYTADARL